MKYKLIEFINTNANVKKKLDKNKKLQNRRRLIGGVTRYFYVSKGISLNCF